MIKITKNIAVLAVFIASACSSGQEKENDYDVTAESSEYVAPVSGKYEIKSGVIHFETKALGMGAKKIVYFDDYGAKERVETYDQEGELGTYQISDGKTRYWINIPDKSAHIADHYGSRGWEMEFPKWSEVKDRDEFKKLPNMTVAGKDCDALQYGDNNIFAGWKGLTLYHGQKSNDLEIKAVKLELDKDVDPSLFQVPEGYEVKEGSYF